MSDDALAELMAGRFRDPDGGDVLPRPATQVVIEPCLAGREADLVSACGLGRHLAVVSDPTTRRVLGRRVERALARVASVEPLVLDDRPEPDEATAANLVRASARADALVAVGSGTVTDLCKFAAAKAGKPFVVFASAPSMNGYVSANAAITVAGHKRSLPAKAARGVFIDLEIFAGSPVRLIRAGLGDALCRSTAQADWLLAHLLLGRFYREAPFALLAADEPVLLERSDALAQGDPEAIASLARTLVLSGFGMTLAGSSEPASQGEHLISHYVEMMGDPSWPRSFHGEQIAVTTLTMSRLQERILAAGPPRLSVSQLDERALIAHFGEDLGRSCWAEFRKKRLDPGAARHLNARLERDWEELRRRVRRVRREPEEITSALCGAGAPTAPHDLGWPEDFYRGAVTHARLIRNRYTFLDLAADSGAKLF